MKQGIHPQYVECTVTCSCGRNTLEPLAVVDNTLSPQANASSTALEQAS
jgi:ribosomal protein L31